MTRANNSRSSSLSLKSRMSVSKDNGVNVGGTAEMFSSLNLGLGDFLVLQRVCNEEEYLTVKFE